MTGTPKPDCTCHGEPMYWQRDDRRGTQGYWVCAEKRRAISREAYHSMSGVKYSLRQLQMRRAKAMQRMRAREAARG